MKHATWRSNVITKNEKQKSESQTQGFPLCIRARAPVFAQPFKAFLPLLMAVFVHHYLAAEHPVDADGVGENERNSHDRHDQHDAERGRAGSRVV